MAEACQSFYNNEIFISALIFSNVLGVLEMDLHTTEDGFSVQLKVKTKANGFYVSGAVGVNLNVKSVWQMFTI